MNTSEVPNGISSANSGLRNVPYAPRNPRPFKSQTNAFQNLALFANMSAEECATIMAAARPEAVERGHIFHFPGDAVRRIVLLTKGAAKIVEVAPNGSAVILRMCGPGEFLGAEISVGQRNSSGAESINSSTVLTWDAGTFRALLLRFPALRGSIVRATVAQLRDMETRFREISSERVGARLSRQVLRLADQIGQQVSEGVEINLLREELAQLIGTTVFTVSRLLCQWSRIGIVKIRREAVIVCNRRGLEELSERMGQLSMR